MQNGHPSMVMPNCGVSAPNNARARADKLNDPIIRGRMLMIADHYDRIAHYVEN